MKMKKLASLFLVLMMVVGMSSAFAAMEGEMTGGSITIDNAVSGQTYSAYQILYLESYNAEAGAYAYKANTAWAEWLKTQTTYVNIDDQGYVTWVEGASAAAFAKLAQAQLAGKTADKSEDAKGTSVTLSDLKLGYYLVDTTLGTLCSLDTTRPNIIMKEKNEAPTVTKEVQEDDGEKWGKNNDADINQVVNFKATIAVKAGAENYILHDTMSAGLTFKAITSVTVDGADVPETNYTISAPGSKDNCTFEIAFNNAYIATQVGKTIIVEYSATLNENAVVGLDGNTNKVILQYGDTNKPSYTPEDTTITYTWDAKVIKYTVKGTEEVTLAGATFKLSTDEAGANVIKFHDLGENNYEVCAATACEKAHATEITTDATGTFNIEGLDAGTYYLTETAAPEGYNILKDPVTIVITGATEKDGTLVYSTLETKVKNETGAVLPETGGMGTTLFYIAGSILVVGALVLMITKRRVTEK